MKTNRSKSNQLGRRLTVAWNDSIWFPLVQSCGPKSVRSRHRPVQWPCQIITDPTVCRARTITLA